MTNANKEDRVIAQLVIDACSDIQAEPCFAVPYGSRADGLEDAGSDYDVFFVFANDPLETTLGNGTETTQRTIDVTEPTNELDRDVELHGWSLTKFVGSNGVAGSNPTAIYGCITEPYYVNTKVSHYVDGIRDHGRNFFKQYALIKHQISKAKAHFHKYIQEGYTIKDGRSIQECIATYDIADPAEELAETDPSEIKQYVDEQHSTIGPDSAELSIVTKTETTENIETDALLDAGLVRETTTDRSVKRYLNIVQAIITAKFIIETNNYPTDPFPDIVEQWAQSWLPPSVYEDICYLIDEKTSGNGSDTLTGTTKIDSWIRGYLSSDFDSSGLTERQPDTALLEANTREILDTLY